MARRSPRDGWSIVELRDGRWQVATTGDREQLKVAFAARVSTIHSKPLQPGESFTDRYNGVGVALFDALGQRRDECPYLVRLADRTRIEWPSTVPGPEGADVTVWQPKAVA